MTTDTRVTITGHDDWLIMARTADGSQVYAVCETWPVWLDAPHHGETAYGTPENAEDWAYVLAWAQRHVDQVTWLPLV